MSSFTKPLYLEYLNGDTFRLLEEFDFASERAEKIIRVPKDFITDFASVPRVFWNILPPTGPYGKAAVIHDYLYQTHLTPKHIADQVFLEGMEVLEVNWFKRKSMYLAVKMFGQAAYDRYTPNG